MAAMTSVFSSEERNKLSVFLEYMEELKLFPRRGLRSFLKQSTDLFLPLLAELEELIQVGSDAGQTRGYVREWIERNRDRRSESFTSTSSGSLQSSGLAEITVGAQDVGAAPVVHPEGVVLLADEAQAQELLCHNSHAVGTKALTSSSADNGWVSCTRNWLRNNCSRHWIWTGVALLGVSFWLLSRRRTIAAPIVPPPQAIPQSDPA
eukprot:ANDGO_04559.mRNA.1 hypothetical protein